MDLVLPKLADPVEEERRLFYAGLTRAKHKAIILTNSIQPSEFILELESGHVDSSTIEWISHEEKRIPCPKCKKGSLIFPNVKLTKRVCSRQSLCGHREK